MHLKCDCKNRSIVNGVREPILMNFVLDKLSALEIYKEPRIKVFRKMNNSVLSHIMFYTEHDDHKPVKFIGQMITFTCQLIKK